MVLTEDVDLPTAGLLTTEEANVSSVTLMAAAPYIGKMCESVNNEFMLCRQETNDPRCCLESGTLATGCALEVLRRIKKECLKEFKQYAYCIEQSSGDFAYRYCRKTQNVFDQCMETKLSVTRPEFGRFCRGRIHRTEREPQSAPPCACPPLVPDYTPCLPPTAPRKPPRFGSRFYHMTE